VSAMEGTGGGGAPGRGAAGRRAQGRAAESLAAAFLEARGFEILDRNHSTRRGEVDLVCRDGEVLCFVEVRSRTSEAFGGPEETVDRRKARRVVAAAEDWAARNGGLERSIRFDVVAVTMGEAAGPKIDHFEGAFDGDGSPGHW